MFTVAADFLLPVGHSPGWPPVLEAAKGFRRVQGCQDMPALVAALRARDARLGLGESSEMVA